MKMNRVTRHWHTLLLVALAALGMVLVLLRNHPYGPGMHWDAVNYIATASNLLAGKGWIQLNGIIYTYFAPLYPLLLALSGLLSGFDPLALAGPLNALLFGLTVFTFGHWLRERIKSRWLALWGGLALACSLPLTAIFATAMSEPVFILFIVLALFSMDRFWRRDQAAALIGAGLFTALACLTRYAGIALLMTLLLFLLLQPGWRLRERIKHGALFLLTAGLPFGLWLLYNTARVGGPFGNRLEGWPQYHPEEAVGKFVEASFSTLGRWILPDLPLESSVALSAVALFALAITVGAAFIRVCRQPKWWPRWGAFCLCGGLILVYLTFMGILFRITYYDMFRWHSRYWTPLYIPLLFVLVFALDRWLMRLREARGGGIILLAALLFIWLGGIAELNRQALVRANRGEGEHRYSAKPRYMDNEVIRFIRQSAGKFLLNVTGYSRLPVLYLYTEHPMDSYSHLPHDLAELYEMVAAADEGDWLIWFLNGHRRPYSYGPAELEAMPELEQITQLDDVLIFQIVGNWRLTGY